MDYLAEEKTYVEIAIELAGGPSAVAATLKVRPWAVSKWCKKIPPKRVITLSSLGGWRVTPHMIAPELYPHPEDGLPDEYRKITQ